MFTNFTFQTCLRRCLNVLTKRLPGILLVIAAIMAPGAKAQDLVLRPPRRQASSGEFAQDEAVSRIFIKMRIFNLRCNG